MSNTTLQHAGTNGFGRPSAEVSCMLVRTRYTEEAVYGGSLLDDGTMRISRLGAGYGYTVHPGARRGQPSGFIPADAEELLWQGIDQARAAP